MANSSATFRLQYPSRSISLPTRLHPNATKIETQLNKLKSLQISSPEAIQNGLVSLAELYNSVQEFMQSSTTQQALLHHQNGIIVENAIDESVELLDSCSYVHDLLSMLKEHVQKLQSAIRRKNGDSSIKSDINSFFCFRKKVKKDVLKSLRKLKQIESRIAHLPLLDTDQYYLLIAIRGLREITAATIFVLRSLLLFFSWPSYKTKLNRWPLISKLMLTKSAVINEMGSVDIAISSILDHFGNGVTKVSVQMLQKKLLILDAAIMSFSDGIECLFRQLVQNRVSLLNILT